MSDALVVLTSVPDRATGERLATALLEARAAACVHIGAEGVSVYRWKGKIERDTEHKVFIKTTRGKLADVERIVKAEHGYEVPELLALTVDHGSDSYLSWLREETRD